MSSIVIDLQDEILSSDCDIVQILRRAHVIAVKLGLKEFDQWISYELNGYPVAVLDVYPNQSYNSFERLPLPMPISISSIACNGSFLVLEKSFPGNFTHASKFAAVLFIARNNAARIRSGYDLPFTRKASLKNVVIFKAKPSIFTDLSSGFYEKYYFYMSPPLHRNENAQPPL